MVPNSFGTTLTKEPQLLSFLCIELPWLGAGRLNATFFKKSVMHIQLIALDQWVSNFNAH